jgi:hypothetical protein
MLTYVIVYAAIIDNSFRCLFKYVVIAFQFIVIRNSVIVVWDMWDEFSKALLQNFNLILVGYPV